jgi:tight adherence protein C
MTFTLNEISAVTFAIVTIMIYMMGATIVRARGRVRNINDVDKQFRPQRMGWLRRSLAESIPQPAGEVERLNQDLKRAGYYGMNASLEFRATRNLLILLISLLGMGAAIAAPPGTDLPQWMLLITAVSVVAAYALPRAILHGQASKRLGSIQRGLPDALDIIHMCLTGGLPLRDALARVSSEVEFFHSDVAVELEVVRRHAEMDSMTKALREFAARMNAPDVNALASLVTQSERTGTNVAVAVTEFSDGIRRQFRQRAEERAQKTSIRMLFPVLLCLAPPVMILLLGPPALQLRTFLQGARNPGGILNAPADIPSASQSNQ